MWRNCNNVQENLMFKLFLASSRKRIISSSSEDEGEKEVNGKTSDKEGKLHLTLRRRLEVLLYFC